MHDHNREVRTKRPVSVEEEEEEEEECREALQVVENEEDTSIAKRRRYKTKKEQSPMLKWMSFFLSSTKRTEVDEFGVGFFYLL